MSPAPAGGRWSRRFGYAAADAAATVVWTIVGGYLVVYYTDVALLPAGAVGTLMLTVRLVDAAVAPVVGTLIDRTRTRWGRSRPYFLWVSVPFAGLAVLTFSSPDWSEPARLAWAYTTYLALSVLYSAATVPVLAILAAVTSDDRERVRLAAMSTAGNLVASVAAGAAALPLVALLGRGDDGHGYLLTLSLFGVVAVLLFLYAFAALPEGRAARVPARPGVALAAIRGNGPVTLVIVAGVLINIASVARVGSTIYFLRDYLGREDLVPLVFALPILMALGLPLAVGLSRRFGKRNTMIVALLVQAVGFGLPVPFGQAVLPVVAGVVVSNVGLGILISVEYAIVADVIDYSHWRSGVRAEGLIASLAALSSKVGGAIGGGVLGWLLAAGGYDADAARQSAAAVQAIRFCFYGLPVLTWVLVAGLLLLYRVDALLPRIRVELASLERVDGA